jgi:hypothetical protein
MASKNRKSKKPSATKLPPEKRLESIVFFIDRSLGGKTVPEALRAIGLQVEIHSDHFPDDAPDILWLQVCGQHHWVVLAKDRNIKRNPLEREALFNAGLAAFFLTKADMTGEETIQAIVTGLPRIANLLASERRPFIARILPDGRVELWLNHKGKDRLK